MRADAPSPRTSSTRSCGHDQPVDHGVGQARVDGHARIRQQRPRRRGPDRQRGGVTEQRRVRIDDREPHVRRLVLFVRVDAGLAQLVARKGCAAAGAVRDDLEILVEQPLIEQLAEVPPHGLDVGRAQRPVGRIRIEPVADPRRQPGELVDIGIDRLTAQPDELGDADLILDLLLAGDAELLLHLDLDREAMGVPPATPGDIRAPHGVKPAEEVLVDAGPDVMEPGHPVRGGRSLVEDPLRRALPLFDGAFEDALRRPAGQLGLLEGNEISIGGDRCEHARSMVVRPGKAPEAWGSDYRRWHPGPVLRGPRGRASASDL